MKKVLIIGICSILTLCVIVWIFSYTKRPLGTLTRTQSPSSAVTDRSSIPSDPPTNSTLSSQPLGKHATIKTRLFARAGAHGVFVTPLQIIEDSRCPKEVACMWSGTVRLRAKIETSTTQEEVLLQLTSPTAVSRSTVSLIAVDPLPPLSLNSKNYMFTFSVAY